MLGVLVPALAGLSRGSGATWWQQEGPARPPEADADRPAGPGAPGKINPAGRRVRLEQHWRAVPHKERAWRNQQRRWLVRVGKIGFRDRVFECEEEKGGVGREQCLCRRQGQLLWPCLLMR